MICARILSVILLAICFWAAPVSNAPAQNLSLQTIVSSGLTEPLFLTAPPGDHNRLFILEKGGRVRIFDRRTSSLLSTPYLSIPVAAESEGGLLGLAFDPGFASNGRFYVNYTTAGAGDDRGDLVVARYTASGDPMSSNIANVAGENVLRIEHSDGNSHYGGWIGFRPTDPGRLYITVGDGFGSLDLPNNAQNVNTLLGKMLRIDVSGPGGYTIPSGNLMTGLPEIYQLGLRNPWRASFDRATGDLWIGDVGQSAREEIDFQAAASPGRQNFGWRTKEGTLFTGLNPPIGGLTDPIYDYPHDLGGSVTGGYVYRGGISELQGHYLFGDYVSGRTWTLTYDGTTLSELTERTHELDPDGSGPQTMAFQLASFGEDAEGELYMLALQRGAVYRIVPEPSSIALAVAGAVVFTLLAWRRTRKLAR